MYQLKSLRENPNPNGPAGKFTSPDRVTLARNSATLSFDSVRSKKFLEFLFGADPFVVFGLSFDVFHRGRSLRNPD